MAFMMMFSSALSSPNSLKLEHQAFWERSLSMSTSHVKDRHIAIDMVTVGDLGNENDPLTGNLFGAVDYKYQIGKYDVTIQQYTQFLNSVAASDPYERRIKLSLAFCSLVPRDLTPTGCTMVKVLLAALRLGPTHSMVRRRGTLRLLTQVHSSTSHQKMSGTKLLSMLRR